MSKIENGNITVSLLENIMGDRFGRYSKYIIQERALPDVRDGLKPVQRRILYAMFKEGNVFEKPHRKSAKTVGIVIGNYHPHGDSSVYEAMVRLSQEWKVRYPLIDMHGNNGSIDDDPAAAMRYTEARMSSISTMLMADIDANTVLFAPNFDDTELEPTVLPSRLPLLLANGATGIAAGYATNIPPHNLNEIIDGLIYRINFPESNLAELMDYIQGPDFPTGGIVQGKEGIQEAFETGKGKVVIRAKATIEKERTLQQIVITEIPYEVVKSNLVKKMDEIRLNKDIDGILDIRDETDRSGLKIVVDVKKDADVTFILNYLYKHTDLQVNYHYNMVAIENKCPKQLGLIPLLDAFIAHRKEVVLKRSAYLLSKMEKRCVIINGLIRVLSILDEVIALIRSSKDKADAKKKLMEQYDFVEEQAEAIVNLRLYRLTNTDIQALKDEFKHLVSQIEETKAIIEHDDILRHTLIKELRQMKEDYPASRLTQIEDEITEINIDKLAMIQNESVMISVSRDGYLKKVSLRSYQASESFGGVKEGDELIGYLEVETLDNLLIFTTKGNYAMIPVYTIEDARWKDVGMHLNNLLKIEADDKILNAFIIKNFKTAVDILTVSKYGNVKKTNVSQWEVTRTGRLYTAMRLKDDDELVAACLLQENQDIVLVSANGYTVHFKENEITETAVKSQGVRGIKLSKDDYVVGVSALSQSEQLVVVNTHQAMKRIKYDQIPMTTRAIKGLLIAKQAKRNPWLIQSIMTVDSSDSLCFVQGDTTIQVEAKNIPLMTMQETFSTSVKCPEDAYYVKGVLECAIVDKIEKPVLSQSVLFEE